MALLHTFYSTTFRISEPSECLKTGRRVWLWLQAAKIKKKKEVLFKMAPAQLALQKMCHFIDIKLCVFSLLEKFMLISPFIWTCFNKCVTLF